MFSLIAVYLFAFSLIGIGFLYKQGIRQQAKQKDKQISS